MSKSAFYKSETSKHRHCLMNYCNGYGIDIGYGGDPIISSAITIDNPNGFMAYTGDHPLNLGGDATCLRWFTDEILDFVYSSHCLEDFEDTENVIREWLRVLKIGGNLVILCPDQFRYEEHCKKNNELPNAAHKIKDFGVEYLKKVLWKVGVTEIIYEHDPKDDYSFHLVARKNKSLFVKENSLLKENLCLNNWVNEMKNSKTYKFLKFLNIIKI